MMTAAIYASKQCRRRVLHFGSACQELTVLDTELLLSLYNTRHRPFRRLCESARRRQYGIHLPAQQYPTAWKDRSEEHTSELQSLMRISYAVFCLKKKTTTYKQQHQNK